MTTTDHIAALGAAKKILESAIDKILQDHPLNKSDTFMHYCRYRVSDAITNIDLAVDEAERHIASESRKLKDEVKS